MKKAFTLLTLCLAALIAGAQTDNSKLENQIKQYWFVMLSKRPSRSQDSATATAIQNAHIANIRRLYNAGKLKVAGPFGDDGNWQGIFIFDCAS